ncbi:LacI family DNA-binding transcriptional regulator [Halomonas dongshanensis]|uniref:LacI family DNA-binding transcriptional regulator n=1 Tax=Halomonas dongshanensis TaxID=2890835 RepID=A0ABT2EDL6_9GAMM|nr:LacI family DNA-binding transcriptional regulator [Halomonas dongshanensis]MCS2608737.1 LacI family DNA-binding transcriptional regulator [Halomonas dongshanensis]
MKKQAGERGNDNTQKSGRSGSARRVTLSDIAEAAGVSRATVSLVMRESPTIPKRTHDLVLGHAERLGYVYNRAAANLRTSNTHIIGLAVHDITNPYFSEIVAQIQQSLTDQGRVVVLGNTQDSPKVQEEFVNTIREYNVAGLIMSPAAGTDPAWLRNLRNWHLPCVLFSRYVEDVALDYIGGNNRLGISQLTQHLIELGHRRIAFVGANETFSSGVERMQGYQETLMRAGLTVHPELIVRCPATRVDAHDAVIDLLRLENPPTAAVCFNDVAAFGAILALQNLGLKVAQDFSVTGYDDVTEARLWHPALTTLRVPCTNIGQEAVRLLMRRMNERDADIERVLVPRDLRIRGTTAPPATPVQITQMRDIARRYQPQSRA